MIKLKNISKVYQMGDQIVHALNDVSLTIDDGEYVAIIGPSGSGKSTLMNVIGCLDNPSSGAYLLNGQDVSRLRDDQLAAARNKNIGFIFQRFNLMGRISALRNVEMPARYGGQSSVERRQHALEALTAVGLADRVNHTPVELSGGQQQRVAIARALVNQPNLLLADEPTGALDSKTGKDILDLFERLHQERGITVVVVTHDPTVARRADRVISIRDGRVESDLPSARAPASPAEHAEPQAYALAGAIAGAYAGTLVGVAAVASANGNGSVEDAAGTIGPAVSNVGVDPVAPAEPAQPARKLRPAQVWKRGLIAVAIATVANVGLALAAQTLFPVTGRLPIFGLAPVALFTAVFGLIGVALFALLNRRMENPARVFRWVAVGALVLSFVPNIALIMNPALLRQIPGGFGAGQARFGGQGTGQGGQSAGGQQGGQSDSGQQGGTQAGRGGRGNFVPGLGPLGAAFGGNAAGNGAASAARRTGGAGLLIEPMLALMLMHVVTFGIVVAGLTRGLGKKARTVSLAPSGLT